MRNPGLLIMSGTQIPRTLFELSDLTERAAWFARRLIFRNNVKPFAQKYFSFPETQISVIFALSRTSQRGVSRSSRTWCGRRWTRWLRQTSEASADGEAVWS